MAGEGEGSPPSVYSDPLGFAWWLLATELGLWSPKRHTFVTRGLSLLLILLCVCLMCVTSVQISVRVC